MKQMTVDELIGTEVFRAEVEKQLEMEKSSHKDAALRAIEQGVRLKRSPFDSLMERGIMDDVDEVVRLYRGVLSRRKACGPQAEGYRYVQRGVGDCFK